jgi:uridine kinase
VRPRRVDPSEVVDAVAALAAARTGLALFGIDVFGASGKSTLAAAIAARVAGAVVVAVDDFTSPLVSEWDWERFRAQVLLPLLSDRAARYQIWNWDQSVGGDWVDVLPGGLLIVEGVSCTRAEVGAPWDLTIWVDAPREVRLGRAIERDGEAMRWVWEQVWMPSEESYATRERPQERVDLIVSGGAD